MKKILALVLLALLATFAVAPAGAQILPPTDPATITANGGQVCWGIDKSVGAVTIRAMGTWTGTIEPRVRVDLTTTNYTPPTGSTSASSITSNDFITIQNRGFHRVCMVATAAWTGTASFSAVAGGSFTGTSSGGGSPGSSDTTETTQLAVLAAVDTLESLIAATNTKLDTLNGTDLMLGTDFSNVFGTGTLVTTTNADNLALSLDALNVAAFMYVYDGTNLDLLRVGPAGTAASTVLTMQGIAGMTPVLATVSATNLDVQIGGSDTLAANPGTAANWGIYAEDSAHSSTQLGLQILGVRQDSQVDFAADGDYVPFSIDGDGGLRVSIISGAGSGGTALADDADFTDGTTSGTPIGGVAEAASPTTVTEGDFGWAAITLNRALKVTLFSSTGTELSLASDLTVGTAFGTTGPGLLAEYQDFDGAALATATNVDTELEAVPLSASIKGVLYTMPTNEDGSKTPFVDEDVASAAADLLVKIAAIRDDTLDARSGTEGDYEMLHLNANGALWNIDVNSAALLTSNQLQDDVVFADEGAFTYATSKVTAFGAVAESTTDTLADGTVGAPVMTLSRFLRVTPSGYATGGGSPLMVISDNTDNEDEHAVCTGDCTIYSVTAFNHTAASAFLRCEADTAANTTPGSETASANEPDLEIPSNTTQAGGYTISFGVNGISYATALTCWIVSEEAATGTTDVAQNDVRVLWNRVQ